MSSLTGNQKTEFLDGSTGVTNFPFTSFNLGSLAAATNLRLIATVHLLTKGNTQALATSITDSEGLTWTKAGAVQQAGINNPGGLSGAPLTQEVSIWYTDNFVSTDLAAASAYLVEVNTDNDIDSVYITLACHKNLDVADPIDANSTFPATDTQNSGSSAILQATGLDTDTTNIQVVCAFGSVGPGQRPNNSGDASMDGDTSSDYGQSDTFHLNQNYHIISAFTYDKTAPLNNATIQSRDATENGVMVCVAFTENAQATFSQYSIEQISGGTFNGSGGKPASTNSGGITAIAGDVVFIICMQARANVSADYHEVVSIDSSTLSWTKIIDEDFTWTDSAADPSFPVAAYHCDVFMAKAVTTHTTETWSSTMSGADTFINEGYCSVLVIRGADDLDTDGSNLGANFNLSGTPSAISTDSWSTDDANPFLITIMLAHTPGTGSPPTITPPAGGWVSTVPGEGNTHFSPSGGAAATGADNVVWMREASSALSSEVISASSHGYWAAFNIALMPASGGGDGDADGDLVTATASVAVSGTAGQIFQADGDLVTATSSVAESGTVATQAIDGTKLFEFTPLLVASTVFQENNYDSIYGRGDRVASGLITTGEYGWDHVFSGASSAFNNAFGVGLGDGPDQTGSATGASFWWTFDQPVDMRGIMPVGTEELTDDAAMWSLYGGTEPGVVSAEPYTLGGDGFTLEQRDVLAGAAFTLYYKETTFEPRLYVPFQHYEILLQQGPRLFDRLCNEYWFKVAHSGLDGGDRRPSAFPSKRVAFTYSSHFGVTATGGAFDTPQEALFDGGYEQQSGKKIAGLGDVANVNNPVSAVGAYLQFVFPRPVSHKHFMFVNYNNSKETYTGDDPDHYGVWHWEYSTNSGATWTAVGDPWSFHENCQYMVAPRTGTFDLPAVGDTGQGATHWRMVLDQGPVMGGTWGQFLQIIFDLEDVTGQAPPLEILFTDDTDGIPVVATIGGAGNPFEVRFSDGSDDGFNTLTLINVPNPVLNITFNDEAVFDTWSDLYPSTVVQTIVISTGKG